MLSLIAQLSYAVSVEISEISEDCIHDVQEKFSQKSGVKVNEFNGVVADGGGYGIYKSFSITYLPPTVGKVTFDGAALSVTPEKNDLSGLVELIQTFCQKSANKASQSDLRKLSSFLQKPAKKQPIHSGSC